MLTKCEEDKDMSATENKNAVALGCEVAIPPISDAELETVSGGAQIPSAFFQGQPTQISHQGSAAFS